MAAAAVRNGDNRACVRGPRGRSARAARSQCAHLAGGAKAAGGDVGGGAGGGGGVRGTCKPTERSCECVRRPGMRLWAQFERSRLLRTLQRAEK